MSPSSGFSESGLGVSLGEGALPLQVHAHSSPSVPRAPFSPALFPPGPSGKVPSSSLSKGQLRVVGQRCASPALLLGNEPRAVYGLSAHCGTL